MASTLKNNNAGNIMRKTIFITLCALSINGSWAQELPKWAKKAKKAVFSVITYNTDNKILNTGNGFYIDSDGTGVSDYSIFKGAHRAVVVTAEGKELPVTLILGANDIYDVVRFKTEATKKQEYLSTATVPGKENDRVYVMPYSTQSSVKGATGTIQNVDSIGNNSFYYTISISTGAKDVSCPLMNEDGEVIGMIQRNSDSKDNKSYALGIDYAKNLSVNALSGNDATLKSIKIKKGLPEDESQALVFLYIMSSQLDAEEYLSLLNDFTDMYPNNMEGYIRRATYYMDKNSDESVSTVEDNLKRTVDVAENKSDAHYSIAKLIYNYCVSNAKKPEKADWTLRRALDEINQAIAVSGEGLYYQVQGDIYFAMKDYSKAATAYENVCKTPLSSASAYYAVAKAKELVEDTDKREIIALMDSAVAYFNTPYGKDASLYLFERARIKSDAKMYKEAVMDYNSFYDAMLGQVSAEFYVIRQQAEMQCHMYQQAINDINKAVELEPSNIGYWTEKGGVHIRLNQIEEAIAALEKAVSLDYGNADALRMLGYCQIKVKDKKRGLENLYKAKELGDTVAEDLIKRYAR